MRNEETVKCELTMDEPQLVSRFTESEGIMAWLAYIDPGAGLLAWQCLVATMVGCMFRLKKCREFVGKLGKRILRRD